MTPWGWAIIAALTLVATFLTGYFVGAKLTYQQLEADTDHWTRPPY